MKKNFNESSYTLQIDVESAVSCLLKAIDIYTDMGRFTMAAKHHQSIAEMYENDPGTLVSQRKYICKALFANCKAIFVYITST